MKRQYLYAAGLLLLPIAYVGVTLANGDAIEWPVFALMALIVVPLIVFKAAINRVPKTLETGVRGSARVLAGVAANSPPGADVRPTRRIAGLVMFGIAAVVVGVEYLLAHVLGIFFPWILLLAGPLATIGVLTAIHPLFFDALVQAPSTRLPAFARWISYATLLAGAAIAIGLIVNLHQG